MLRSGYVRLGPEVQLGGRMTLTKLKLSIKTCRNNESQTRLETRESSRFRCLHTRQCVVMWGFWKLHDDIHQVS